MAKTTANPLPPRPHHYPQHRSRPDTIRSLTGNGRSIRRRASGSTGAATTPGNTTDPRHRSRVYPIRRRVRRTRWNSPRPREAGTPAKSGNGTQRRPAEGHAKFARVPGGRQASSSHGHRMSRTAGRGHRPGPARAVAATWAARAARWRGGRRGGRVPNSPGGAGDPSTNGPLRVCRCLLRPEKGVFEASRPDKRVLEAIRGDHFEGEFPFMGWQWDVTRRLVHPSTRIGAVSLPRGGSKTNLLARALAGYVFGDGAPARSHSVIVAPGRVQALQLFDDVLAAVDADSGPPVACPAWPPIRRSSNGAISVSRFGRRTVDGCTGCGLRWWSSTRFRRS